MDWTAIVLTGGNSRRLGRDKAAEPVGGVPMLQRVVSTLPDSVPLLIVGPNPVGITRTHRVCREDPPGTGPVAAIAAALPHAPTPTVVVLATDQPFLGETPVQLSHLLRTAAPTIQAVLAADRDGVAQPLCAAYRTEDLRRALAGLPTVHNASMRSVQAALHVAIAPPSRAKVDPTVDVDTQEDLRRAQSLVVDLQEANMMDEWITAVTAELGLDGDVDVDAVLDVAKDVAHQVQRPAAPVTTYLVGVAVGRGMSVADASATVRALANNWPK